MRSQGRKGSREGAHCQAAVRDSQSGSFGQMEEGLAVSFARAGKMNRALRILVCLVVAIVVVVGMVVPIVAYIVYRFVL